QEKAHGAAAGVPHQDGGGLGVDPQVGQQRPHEHRRSGDVAGQLLGVQQSEGAHADHRQAGGQTVHAVGAVDHVDAGPDQDDDQQQVDRVGQHKIPVQEPHPTAVEVQVGDAGHQGNDKVDQ